MRSAQSSNSLNARGRSGESAPLVVGISNGSGSGSGGGSEELSIQIHTDDDSNMKGLFPKPTPTPQADSSTVRRNVLVGVVCVIILLFFLVPSLLGSVGGGVGLVGATSPCF